MQLLLILGIVFTIGAVVFALQNNVAITVTFAIWQFEGSQALVLLLSLGLGVLITCLLSSPTVIRRQWAANRMRRQIADLERKVTELQGRETELLAKVQQSASVAATDPVNEQKPYVGLRSLLSGVSDGKSVEGAQADPVSR